MNNLDKAKSLELPQRDDTLRRAESVHRFWLDNQELFVKAWQEWDESESLPKLDSSLFDPKLKESVDKAWSNPEEEKEVLKHLEEVSTGVYQFQLFNPEKLKSFREYLDKVENSGIPLRPPYGIVLNRKGAMLDQRSEGFLAAASFQNFYKELMDKYMRPIARLLFPEIVGFDSQTFGFSIQYQAGMDTSIRMHTDASSVTLNINLNLPDETYKGSEVDFHDPVKGKVNRVTFKPGVALIHRGSVAHQAHPITEGERTNLVLWLYGQGMMIPRGIYRDEPISAKDRWTIPKIELDKYAPF